MTAAAVITGANGFVGRHLCPALTKAGVPLRVLTTGPAPSGSELLGVALSATVDELARAFDGAGVVYHLAGVAHERMANADPDRLWEVNVDATARVLAAADLAQVPQLVWLSSIKVLGDVSVRPLRPNDPYDPGDAYARSKVRAEQTLLDHPARSTHVAIVRPPLVYGPGVAGNFRRMLRWIAGGVPLPLANATALRSMVAVANLCDLLRCLATPDAGIFHVADATDLSVAEVIRTLGEGMGQPARLWAAPLQPLAALARLAGREATYSRLFEPLQVDFAATCSSLQWQPPQDNVAALRETAAWFRRRQ